VNGKRLIEIKMPFKLFKGKMVFKDIKTLQGIGLFDVRGAKDTVPAPLLVDWPLAFLELINLNEFLVEETILLQVYAVLFRIRKIKVLGYFFPNIGFRFL